MGPRDQSKCQICYYLLLYLDGQPLFLRFDLGHLLQMLFQSLAKKYLPKLFEELSRSFVEGDEHQDWPMHGMLAIKHQYLGTLLPQQLNTWADPTHTLQVTWLDYSFHRKSSPNRYSSTFGLFRKMAGFWLKLLLLLFGQLLGTITGLLCAYRHTV